MRKTKSWYWEKPGLCDSIVKKDKCRRTTPKTTRGPQLSYCCWRRAIKWRADVSLRVDMLWRSIIVSRGQADACLARVRARSLSMSHVPFSIMMWNFSVLVSWTNMVVIVSQSAYWVNYGLTKSTNSCNSMSACYHLPANETRYYPRRDKISRHFWKKKMHFDCSARVVEIATYITFCVSHVTTDLPARVWVCHWPLITISKPENNGTPYHTIKMHQTFRDRRTVPPGTHWIHCLQ